MIAHLNTEELEALLKDFHLLTGIKIVVFDTDYEEIIAWPDSHCDFCRVFKKETGLPAKKYRALYS